MGNIRMKNEHSGRQSPIEQSQVDGEDATFHSDEIFEEDSIRTESYFASCSDVSDTLDHSAQLIESTTIKAITTRRPVTVDSKNDADSSVGSANISLPLSDTIIPDNFDISAELSSNMNQLQEVEAFASPTITILSDALSRISLKESTDHPLGHDAETKPLTAALECEANISVTGSSSNPSQVDGPPPEIHPAKAHPKESPATIVRTDSGRNNVKSVSNGGRCATNTKAVPKSAPSPDPRPPSNARSKRRKKQRSERSSIATSDVEGSVITDSSVNKHNKRGESPLPATSTVAPSSTDLSVSRKHGLHGSRWAPTSNDASVPLDSVPSRKTKGNRRLSDAGNAARNAPSRRQAKDRVTHKTEQSTKEALTEPLPDSCRGWDPSPRATLDGETENIRLTVQAKNVLSPPSQVKCPLEHSSTKTVDPLQTIPHRIGNPQNLASHTLETPELIDGHQTVAAEPVLSTLLESYETPVRNFPSNVHHNHHRAAYSRGTARARQSLDLDSAFWPGVETHSIVNHAPTRNAPLPPRMDPLVEYWRRVHETWDGPRQVGQLDFQTNARPLEVAHHVHTGPNVNLQRRPSTQELAFSAVHHQEPTLNHTPNSHYIPNWFTPPPQSTPVRISRMPNQSNLPPRHQPQNLNLPRTIRPVTSMPMLNQPVAHPRQPQLWGNHLQIPVRNSSEQGFHDNPPPPQVLNLSVQSIPGSPQVPEQDFNSKLMHDFSARARQHSVTVRSAPTEALSRASPVLPSQSPQTPVSEPPDEGASERPVAEETKSLRRAAFERPIVRTKPEEILSWRAGRRDATSLKSKTSMPTLRYIHPGARSRQKTAETESDGPTSTSTSPRPLEDVKSRINSPPPPGASPQPSASSNDSSKENGFRSKTFSSTGGKFSGVDNVRTPTNMNKASPSRKTMASRYPAKRVANGARS